ncbi:broad-complex core protein isoforms 1/2/3/4/5-like [Maniola hyperantus]|uniref:broad-complex core protein isoforms 1/2/3/4/5-like n=1 Tax=Aphantopus hyperantus TaxID=2795564 RepID=UPI001569BB88|nr:broad-complex core protein isoforms 1/2/3/4/5-like isoform X1 [Maniola hyperantus]
MNNAPQFSLRWNNYVTHVTEAFNALRFENDLVDVTLCCDGGKIRAHKMLLSACSSYFRQIFKENPCQHPVIIFRNFKFEDLNAIINFMYHGEVNIFQEQLESFLITAELLEVKGLTDNVEEESSSNQLRISDNNSLDLSSKSNRANDLPVPVIIEEPVNLTTLPWSRGDNIPQDISVTSQDSEIEVQEPQPETSKIDIGITKQKQIASTSEEMQIDTQSTSAEDLTDKTNSESDLAKFRCQLCPKGFKHPTSLTLHKDSHAGKTQCPVCHRSFSRSYDMRSHLQRIHQGKQLTIKEIRYKNNSDSVPPKQFTHNI